MTRQFPRPTLLGFRRTLRTRYTFALLITALVALAQFVILTDEIYAQRQQARVVDLAARQRTLAVEIASLASAYVDASVDAKADLHQRLVEDASALANVERELTDPSSPSNPRGWPPASVRALFDRGVYDVSARTSEFIRHATRLLATPPASLTRSDEDLIDLSNLGPDLAYRYGIVVDAYVADGRDQRSSLLLHEALGLAALLVTLALEFPLIFAPLEAELDAQVRALVTDAYKRSGAERIAHLGTWERDVATGEVNWSDELRRICALGDDDPTPDSFAAFDHPDDAPSLRRALRIARESRASFRMDHRIRTRSGETRWVQESLEFIRSADGTIERELGTAFDITERKTTEAELFKQANHDVLTGLPNRRYLRDRLETEIAAANERGVGVALLYADLDRFKTVNDSLGHGTGDDILRLTATRLTACVRANDVVARTGGDEFVVLLAGLRGRDEAERTAARIVEVCGKAHPIGGKELYAPLSVGVATFPDDARDVDGLMRAADRAMYEAKDAGGNRYVAFTDHLAGPAYDRFALETHLRGALERNELDIAYQPIVASDGHTIGFEALARWTHADLGSVSPERFIPIAEEAGLIHALGAFVLTRATAFVRTLQTGDDAGLRLAVNVSSRQFGDAAFSTLVRETLAATGFDPSLLDLEITESAVMHDVESAIATMRAFKAMRVRISIDDFGTGFSSLGSLRRFPIDTLKIDRTFVHELTQNASDAAIVESILSLARNLRLSVVAEGIETSEQRDVLVALRCDEFQGYFFSRPLPASDVLAWLASTRGTAGTAARLRLVR